jgi:diguanylate cyclase (GGDEF)-like protein
MRPTLGRLLKRPREGPDSTKTMDASALISWRRARGRSHWPFLCAAAAAFAAGILAPGVAGPVALLASAALTAFALAAAPGAPPHLSGRARTAVDGLITAASVLLIAWVAGLGDLWASGRAAHPALDLAVAVAEVAVAAAAIVMVTRSRDAARPLLGAMAGALTLIAVGGGAMVYRDLGGATTAVALLYAGWPAGWALIAIACRRTRDDAPEEEHEPGLPTRASVLIPSTPFAVAVLGAAYAGARGDFDGFLVWNAAAVIVLIVMRQVLALLENIAFWHDLEAKLKTRERRFRALVQNSADVIAVFSEDGDARYVSPSGEAIAQDDVPRLSDAARKLAGRPGATQSVELRLRHRDGGHRDMEARVANLLDDPAVDGYVVNARDITERKALEHQLTHRAFHDPLTELANRALFADRLEQALRRRSRPDSSLAVLCLDLDDFKDVNDSLGHAAGDDLLAAVARRLGDCIRAPDTVARLGGDEFALLLEDVEGDLGAARVAQRVLAAFDEPLGAGGRELVVTASIGIATNSPVGRTGQDLLRNADVAMYAAKSRGKGGFEHFEQGMHAALVERLALEADLRSAIDREEFVLHYQPVVELPGGAVRGVEALIRWQHPERGLLSPAHFVELAEHTGLIIPIGSWALSAACRQAVRWRDELGGAHPVAMSVNLSVRQLRDPRVVEHVRTALQTSRLDPADLLLEITESVMVDEEAMIRTLADIRKLGVRLAIDDFGSKYSSLSYLRRLPIDVLKVDREFVRGVAPGSSESALLEAILAMSESMGLDTIVEGVETGEEEEELERMGCRLAQGFRFAIPLEADAVARMLAGANAAPRRARR